MLSLMSNPTLTDAKRRVVDTLKRRGPQTAGELAAALGLTDVAIRQHLDALATNGLVESVARPVPDRGRGRPSSAWRLTSLATDLFPDRHADLTVEFIRATREALGEEGLLRIVEVRARDQTNLYRATMPAGSSLKKRVEALAARRSAEGYMAEVVQVSAPRSWMCFRPCWARTCPSNGRPTC
jgi:predicted ArsR family transcriptional regulator